MTDPASSSSRAVAAAGAVPVSPPAAGVTQGDHTVPAPGEPALPPPAAGAKPRPQSFSSFLLLWFGQLVSVIGSGLTGFALGVWVYQQTGSVTRFSLILLSTTLPGILLSPLAGTLVDRWDRRWAMVLSDSVAGLMTLTIALLLYFDQLQLWMLYAAMVVSSTFASLRWPAFSAATTLMVPKRHLSRAAGLSSMGQSASSLLAPILGGLLLVTFGIHMVLLIDVTTFAVAIALALAVRVPRPEPVNEAGQAAGQGKKGGGSLFAQAGHGWTYLKERPGLMGILFFSAFANLALGMIQVLAPPMVLAFASPGQLGTAMSTAGLGMLIGSLLMTVWKGPARRIDGVLGFMAFCGLGIVAAALRPSLVQFAVAGFLFYFAFAISGACGQALWQLKVAPGFQGRVFAIRRLVGWSTFPIAFLCAGPLADRLFKPLLLPDGALAGSVGRWVGVGPGRGVALLLILAGLALFAVSVASYASPRVRRVEIELPDVVSD